MGRAPFEQVECHRDKVILTGTRGIGLGGLLVYIIGRTVKSETASFKKVCFESSLIMIFLSSSSFPQLFIFIWLMSHQLYATNALPSPRTTIYHERDLDKTCDSNHDCGVELGLCDEVACVEGFCKCRNLVYD
ncbi:uncharacterized protein LOC120354039 [Nilaparvata lugens]|uniref:uncharacterized protein LOC120354039 n=1 Tax=Nilaparvata lugens TaxID=108931 RepID=UPI00193CC9C9|nr:uncharacterized protein LOC120354039 [Nilaparvata lugens]XP_039295894.1 uncharacterized protein LOC120354039 [Nilaparvata lugens]